MTTHPRRHRRLLDLGRLVSLRDGVFAVVMTLLILDLKLPSQSNAIVNVLEHMLA